MTHHRKMDTNLTYQNIICELLFEYEAYLKTATGLKNQTITPEIVIDKEHNHFQLLLKGWSGYQYTFKIAFHLDIINEKIWLQQNNTEFRIADELVEKGVSKSDIVLGFILPQQRQYTEFAVA
jgi:XisI protein